MSDTPTLLIVSQTYVPDTPSVGQHMHDAAAEMVCRGWRVVVFTSARGYETPGRRFASRETRDGVRIRRLPLSSFGKTSMFRRLLGGLLFVAQAAVRGLFVRDLSHVLVSTSPPFAPLVALILRMFRRIRVIYWAMDLNPDQAIVLERVDAASPYVRLLEHMNRRILRVADVQVALDRFMAQRLIAKGANQDRLTVIPPWPHDSQLDPVEHYENPFRKQFGLAGKFVVMYSGNISPVHPLDTVLKAAERLEGVKPDLVFLFIGGGLGKQQIEEFSRQKDLSNMRTLPYQPLEMLRYSLSAADLHLVSMGDSMVGIVHPCKIYGAMAVGRPIFMVGPAQSHAGEIVHRQGVGWRVDHGDVKGAVENFYQMLSMPRQELRAIGARARRLAETTYSTAALRGRFCDVIENGAEGYYPDQPRHAL